MMTIDYTTYNTFDMCIFQELKKVYALQAHFTISMLA